MNVALGIKYFWFKTNKGVVGYPLICLKRRVF